MVAESSRPAELEEENPDVFTLDMVQKAEMDVDDYRSELYREDRDGNKVSYNPPRYKYTYRFYLDLYLNHPYADHIRFQLNQYAIEIERTESSFSLFGDSFNPNRDYEYRQYKDMGQEIIDRLTRSGAFRENKQPVVQETPAEETVEQSAYVVCPYCGSRTKRARFCENCGGNLD